MNRVPVPGPADIDPLFAFARAAGVKVIYTLRLWRGDAAQDARLARYIADHYADHLAYFSLGNEPDWRSYHDRTGYVPAPGFFVDREILETVPGVPGTAYPSYLRKWNRFSAAVLAAVPDARFGGPDTGSDFPVAHASSTDFGDESWSARFAADEQSSGRLQEIDHHDYAGQGAAGVPVAKAVDSMLSSDWAEVQYPALFNHVFAPVLAHGMRYRMTECNDYTGGVDGASNAFASALWALDYMHWQAEHGATGVNFHNRRWIFTDTILPDPAGGLRMNPKGYAIKAFNLGSAGHVEGLTMDNPARVNLTAYAVANSDNECLTLINKAHGPTAAQVTVQLDRMARGPRAEVLFLTAPDGSPTARSGITLGGAALSGAGWAGHWAPLVPDENGHWTVEMGPASAAIVRWTAR
jgi:hypothetical protein